MLRCTSKRAEQLIRAYTVPLRPPLVPELLLYTAGELTPLWQATAALLEEHQLEAPFWAFPWAGGQALARYLLDQPHLVEGKRVVDFATGSGLVAIAAARAGARTVLAADIDPFAGAAVALNAATNDATVTFTDAELVGQPLTDTDVVLAGDIFYEGPLAEACMAWFAKLAKTGVTVLVGDPGRIYSPRRHVDTCATYAVPTSLELEDKALLHTKVQRVVPA